MTSGCRLRRKFDNGYRQDQAGFRFIETEMMNHSTDDLLLALMARLIRVESMVCSLSILTLKRMAGDDATEYQALSRWLGAVRAKIVESSLGSHAEQFPELSRFIEEHIELSERDLMEMFETMRERE